MTKNKQTTMEVSSDQLMAQLIEIKERVGALENMEALVNQATIEKHVRATVKSSQRKAIMRECREPKSKQDLTAQLGYKTTQALDHHLNPLREASLLHTDQSGEVSTFGWSPLVKRLPKSHMEEILNDDAN